MEREEIIKLIMNTSIVNDWHWFRYHFNFYNIDMEHPFAKSIVDSLYDIGKKINGAEIDIIKKLSSFHGEVKNLNHYEQLMQILAELIIIHKSATFDWKEFERFEYEPITQYSKQNPELNIHLKHNIIGIEVKSPTILEHQKNRENNPFQLTSRFPELLELIPKEKTTFPRDNPIKDFLISADKKFSSFKEIYSNYISVLYIVWDDFIYEPISALICEPYGLFMSESFAKDKNGEKLKFRNLDYVIISRHRFQFHQFAGERPFPYQILHPLDYGNKNCFPFKVIIKNPNSTVDSTMDLLDCFQVYNPSLELGAEYYPQDIITWL